MNKKLMLLVCCVLCLGAETWDAIKLPNFFVFPTPNSVVGNFGTNVYSTELPQGPVAWEMDPLCNTYQPNSIAWVSDIQTGVKGLSFKGLVFKEPQFYKQGSDHNGFSIFFHENRCYRSGAEYGWIFWEKKLPESSFYICYDCNILGKQSWTKWPSESKDMQVLDGDPAAVKAALENASIYQHWNIVVTPEGDFRIELVDPVTYSSIYVVLSKPEWFPNLYQADGYVTINGKKQEETVVSPAPFIHVDTIKIYK